MVWFQCEACGDELKKPKLANHFRQCSAYKLSCIDCGESFDQQSVQAHSQCITESEKYGPKGVANATPKGKPNKPDVDTSVGLSLRPPWFCSLCNTQATSQQALLIHADGKKHTAKCRAYAAKLHPNPTPPVPLDAAAQHNALSNANDSKSDNLPLNKRKFDAPNTTTTTNGADNLPTNSKKPRQVLENNKIKWKKLIASLLKSTPDGALKMKKLHKLVLKTLQESGIAVNDNDLKTTLDHKVNSSSKYKVDGKYVRLAV